MASLERGLSLNHAFSICEVGEETLVGKHQVPEHLLGGAVIPLGLASGHNQLFWHLDLHLRGLFLVSWSMSRFWFEVEVR